jgi:hypothetical protein
MCKLSRLVILLPLMASAPATASDAWGDLKLRIVWGGEPPKSRVIELAPGREAPDESLVVHSKDLGLANVCIWLDREGAGSPPVHPDYDLVSSDRFSGIIHDGRVSPHIMIVRPPQSFLLRNLDRVGYNANIDFPQNGALNVTLPPSGTYAKLLEREERLPVRLVCSIHPWLNGYVLVCGSPYSAVSDEHGRLTLDKLPVGKRSFVVWHERVGFVNVASRDGKELKWPRGRMPVEIKPGENDLGEIKLSPALFHK